MPWGLRESCGKRGVEVNGISEEARLAVPRSGVAEAETYVSAAFHRREVQSLRQRGWKPDFSGLREEWEVRKWLPRAEITLPGLYSEPTWEVGQGRASVIFKTSKI